jgi:hypothetical protein
MATQMTEHSRRVAYAKAMAMPGIRQWTRHCTGDNVFYSLEFEGREYYIERDMPGRNPWSVAVKTPPDAKLRMTPNGGRFHGQYRYLGANNRLTIPSLVTAFKTAGQAAQAARAFAAHEGWASESAGRGRRSSRHGSRRSR